jgi:hypothetical protein
VSSVFRTELLRDFAASVRQLPPKVLVILDIGRTDDSVDAQGMRSLAALLRDGSVDILICTPPELRKFAVANGLPAQSMKNGPLFKEVAGANLLPRVTAVRGQTQTGLPTAITIVDGQIDIVEGEDRSWAPARSVGGMNAFNAAFIRALGKRRSKLDLGDTVRAAVREALVYWSSVD